MGGRVCEAVARGVAAVEAMVQRIRNATALSEERARYDRIFREGKRDAAKKRAHAGSMKGSPRYLCTHPWMQAVTREQGRPDNAVGRGVSHVAGTTPRVHWERPPQRPYCRIFLHRVVRLIPRSSAA